MVAGLKRIAWTDKLNRLQFVEVESQAVTLAAKSDAFEIRDFAWSPDSEWLAFTKPEVRRFANIYLYGLAAKTTVQVTDGWFDVGSPEFSSDGKYLFFVSERSFTPTYSQTEWNHVYNDMERIYLVTLAKDIKSPFAPKSDEVKLKDEKKDEKPKDTSPDVKTGETEAKKDGDKPADKKLDGKEEPKKEDKKVVVKVDADGIQQRITVLPPGAAGYGGLTSVGEKLFYFKKGKLHFYELDKERRPRSVTPPAIA